MNVDFPSQQIICGDCIELMNGLPADSVRLVIADPPYFNVLLGEQWDTCWESQADYLDWTNKWLEAAMRILLPGGILYCFGQVGKREHAMLHLMSQATSRWTFHDLLIWDRVVGYNDRRDSWTPSYEMALVLRKGGAEPLFDKDAVREPYDQETITRYSRDKRYKDMEARRRHLEKGKYATNLWRIPSLKGSSNEKVGHPSQKPLALIERIIKSSSKPDEIVVDPFCGSGTTCVAANRLGRKWLGIDISPEYCELSRDRIKKETESPRLLNF